MYTILADVRIEDLDRFLTVFSTAGLKKRTRHGSLGAEVLAATDENDRVFVLIDWRDRAAFEAFLADPEVGPTMARGGAKGRPSFTPLTRQGRLAACAPSSQSGGTLGIGAAITYLGPDNRKPRCSP